MLSNQPGRSLMKKCCDSNSQGHIYGTVVNDEAANHVQMACRLVLRRL